MGYKIKLTRIRKIATKMGSISRDITVDLIKKKITREKAYYTQINMCKTAVMHNGLKTTIEAYKIFMTSIANANIKRQQEGLDPIDVYTTGAGDYFKSFGVTNVFRN